MRCRPHRAGLRTRHSCGCTAAGVVRTRCTASSAPTEKQHENVTLLDRRTLLSAGAMYGERNRNAHAAEQSHCGGEHLSDCQHVGVTQRHDDRNNVVLAVMC